MRGGRRIKKKQKPQSEKRTGRFKIQDTSFKWQVKKLSTSIALRLTSFHFMPLCLCAFALCSSLFCIFPDQSVRNLLFPAVKLNPFYTGALNAAV